MFHGWHVSIVETSYYPTNFCLDFLVMFVTFVSKLALLLICTPRSLRCSNSSVVSPLLSVKYMVSLLIFSFFPYLTSWNLEPLKVILFFSALLYRVSRSDYRLSTLSSFSMHLLIFVSSTLTFIMAFTPSDMSHM